MADETKRYISVAKFKSFWQKFPWQKARKTMGLGDTLGPLGVDFGGTGGGSLSDLSSKLEQDEDSFFKATFRYDFIQALQGIGGTQTTERPLSLTIDNPKPYVIQEGNVFQISPGIYAFELNLKITIAQVVGYTIPIQGEVLMNTTNVNYTNQTTSINSSGQRFCHVGLQTGNSKTGENSYYTDNVLGSQNYHVQAGVLFTRASSPQVPLNETYSLGMNYKYSTTGNGSNFPTTGSMPVEVYLTLKRLG